eukprot:TRINITY_DN46328_c0_g1_i1.p2 TRINITY_DN46328_c0_g1~~TRINITY_DN46328_c0_g1_i1.p2  ORF type:complete len:253 (+),score=46.63 TRINITY_DN46328_c0_g1_i1:38-760(+)
MSRWGCSSPAARQQQLQPAVEAQKAPLVLAADVGVPGSCRPQLPGLGAPLQSEASAEGALLEQWAQQPGAEGWRALEAEDAAEEPAQWPPSPAQQPRVGPSPPQPRGQRRWLGMPPQERPALGALQVARCCLGRGLPAVEEEVDPEEHAEEELVEERQREEERLEAGGSQSVGSGSRDAGSEEAASSDHSGGAGSDGRFETASVAPQARVLARVEAVLLSMPPPGAAASSGTCASAPSPS